MATLATTVNGLKLPNPFIIGSGPPGTNANVIGKAFDEGWGGVIAKTISLDASKVINVAPRYARLKTGKSAEIYGWQNIELISDRSFGVWIDEFKQLKDKYPDKIVICSIMEEYNKDAWVEIVEKCQDTGVDAFELNFSCPHGLPERKMGAAMGQDCAIMEEVCDWVVKASKVPVWAKLTPNVTHIQDGCESALRAGCHGMSAELLSFMAKHNFESVDQFRGHSLQYFTTHFDLVKRQAEAKALAKAKAKGAVTKDGEWQGDQFVKQTEALTRN